MSTFVQSTKIDALYNHLRNETLEIHYLWRVIGQLYFSNQSIRILQSSAPNLFGLFYNSLFGHLILSITRLTDPASQGKFENASFEQLCVLLENTEHVELSGEIRTQISDISEPLDSLREYRNKRISHADFGHVPKLLDQLPTLQKSNVRIILSNLSQALNLFEDEIGKPSTMFDDLLVTDDGITLLSQLDELQRIRSERIH